MSATELTMTWDHIVVAVIIFFLGGILPWVVKKLWRRGEHIFAPCPPIEGTWIGEARGEDGIITQDVMKLDRVGRWCNGTITVSGGRPGNYEFEGIFRRSILTALYHPTDSKKKNRGAFAILLDESGKVLEGVCAHYDDKTNKIVSQKYTLRFQP